MLLFLRLADLSRSCQFVHTVQNLDYVWNNGRERQVINHMKMKILFESYLKITESLLIKRWITK